MQFGVEPLLDGDRLEVRFPHLLEKFLIGIHQFLAEQAGKKVGFLLFETHFGSLFQVVIVTVLTSQVVKQPALVGKAVLQVKKSEREYVIDRLDGGKESPVRRFLETEKLGT